ncbi:hypothetical protein G7Y41_08740 [Schaalia sp. ZJ405]|uniref:hypothetical protein n=1 Tax=Schaalia sp. ZJ405 TaxID=2709403 RepID=UPI0013EAC844|nr:hypothetical protein [Schaalia sp. ZJ405]QPK81111.1 hypothetical protein G7Y41_08740 [Schaalia sp. ZJ405]
MSTIDGVKLLVYKPWASTPVHTVTQISQIDWSGSLNDHSTLKVTLPAGSTQADWLRGMVEVAFLVRINGAWVEPPSARFFTTGADMDPVKDFGATQVSLIGISQILRYESVTTPTPDNEEGKRVFPAQSPGSILTTLLGEARQRDREYGLDWAPSLAWSFTSSRDSNGVAWGKNARVTFTPSTTFEKVLQWLTTKGAVDWRMNGRELQVFRENAGLAAQNTSVAFIDQYADATPVKTSFEDLTTLARFRGKDGKQWEKNNPYAASDFGRIVRWSEQGQVEREDTATLYLEELLKRGEAPRRQYRREWTLTGLPVSPILWADFHIGDWVTLNGQQLRVIEAGMKMDESGQWSCWATLGDRIEAFLERLARKTTDLSDGMVGGENSPVTGVGGPHNETGTPKAPTGLLASSDPVSSGNGTFASILTLAWDAVTHTVDNKPVAIREYSVQVTENGDRTYYYTTLNPHINIRGYPGDRWTIRVRAKSHQNVWGEWSTTLSHVLAADKEPPPQPLAPTATTSLGILIIKHSGLSSTGGAMPPDVSYWDVAVSTSATTNPQVDTQVADASGFVWYRSGLDVNRNYYVRVRAVDTSGNIGAWSSYTIAQVRPLYDASKLGKELESARDPMGNLIVQIREASIIAPGAIKTAHLEALAVSADKIKANAITGSHIAAGALDAYIVNGAVIQTSTTARRGVKITSRGLYAYDNAGNETVAITGATGTISGYTIKGGVVEQNSGADSIRIAYGRITFSHNNQTQLIIDDDGMSLWEGTRKIGYIDASAKHGDPTVRGLQMSIDTTGDYVLWGYRQKPSDDYVAAMLTLDPKGKFFTGMPGIHFSSDIWLNGNSIRLSNSRNLEIKSQSISTYPSISIKSNRGPGLNFTDSDVMVDFGGPNVLSLKELFRSNGYSV